MLLNTCNIRGCIIWDYPSRSFRSRPRRWHGLLSLAGRSLRHSHVCDVPKDIGTDRRADGLPSRGGAAHRRCGPRSRGTAAFEACGRRATPGCSLRQLRLVLLATWWRHNAARTCPSPSQNCARSTARTEDGLTGPSRLFQGRAARTKELSLSRRHETVVATAQAQADWNLQLLGLRGLDF